MRPSAATIARAVISAVGCGHREVVPYFPHFLGTAFLWVIGKKRSDRFVSEYMRKHYMTNQQRALQGIDGDGHVTEKVDNSKDGEDRNGEAY